MRSLRSWLKIEPHPVRVKATDAEGEDRFIRIGESKSRWRDAENALKSAVHCEALTAEGEILRTWDNEEVIVQQQAAARADEPKTELAELARIITESNDAAVGRLVEILQVNLAQNSQLVNVLSERNRQLELAWQQLLNEHAKLQQSAAQSDGSPALGTNEQLIMQLAPAIVAGLMGGGARAPQQAPPQQPTKQQPKRSPNGAQ